MFILKESWMGRGLHAAVSVVVVGLLTYLCAVRDSFISDDFVALPFIEVLRRDPLQILQWPSECFRAVSYVYFAMCVKAFGASPAPFYLSGIAMHIVVSILVGVLMFQLTKNFQAAYCAALFFTAYERHQEAVMWISAINDVIVTLSCLVFLILWNHSASRPDRRWSYGMALAILPICVFSKESWVSVVPLAGLMLALRDWPWRRIVLRSIPLWIVLSLYVYLWIAVSNRNFFVTEGHYALSWYFLPVYTRSLLRLLVPVLLFLIPLVVNAYTRGRLSDLYPLTRNRSLIFFLALLAVSILPYSFLTYLNHIPSRNTYLPSVGLAAVIGILFATLLKWITPQRRSAAISFLALIVLGNSLYIWIKKKPQFDQRAAPTRVLLEQLHSPDLAGDTGPIYVCGFPLHVSIGQTAVATFAPSAKDSIVFQEDCGNVTAARVLQWEPAHDTYSLKLGSASVQQGVGVKRELNQALSDPSADLEPARDLQAPQQ